MLATLKLFTFCLAISNVFIAVTLDLKLRQVSDAYPIPPGTTTLELWLEHYPLALLAMWAVTTLVIVLHNKLTTGFFTRSGPLPQQELEKAS